MKDDFYDAPASSLTVYHSLFSSAKLAILASPGTFIITLILLPILIFVATRLLSGHLSIRKHNGNGKNENTVWLPPYWLPFIGHGYQMLTEPMRFMQKLRNKSHDGVFALRLGSKTHNIISDPKLVTNALEQQDLSLTHEPIALDVAQRFFGIPKSSLPKYQEHGAKLEEQLTAYLLQEPALGKLTRSITRQLENMIPQMLSFTDTDIDLQPWERRADSNFISSTETEVNLMSLMRDTIGNTSVPVIFGHALLEKYPDVLHEVYTMDEGMWFFLMGLPRWFPWAKSIQAHFARQKVWRCMDDYQRALDANALGKEVDPRWGDLDDVSELMLKRNEIYRNGKFEVKERGDTGIIWDFAKSNVLVYWIILYILSTPGLLARIRAEIAPYITISKAISIGSFSEAPQFSISHQELIDKCPLLKSCYLETLRMTSSAYSIRKIESDTTLSSGSTEPSFTLNKGEYLTIPHALHMQDLKYFISPNEFIPDRFLVTQDDGKQIVDADMKGMRPYGGGESMCKGWRFEEMGCLGLVAGVLAYYDIEPSDRGKGWVVPMREGRGSIVKPVGETRVRIRRRVFVWDDDGEADKTG